MCSAGGAVGWSVGSVAPPAEEAGGRFGCWAEDGRRSGKRLPSRESRTPAAEPRPLTADVSVCTWLLMDVDDGRWALDFTVTSFFM